MLPNAYYLTEFGTEPRRLLIEITRYHNSLAIIIPDGALAYENYNLNKRGHNARKYKDPKNEALRPQVKKDANGNLLNRKSYRRCGSTKHLKFEISGYKKCNSCIPINKLQEDIIINYVKQLSYKDIPAIPEKVERLEITDMSFYYSPRGTEDFNSKKDSIKAIFIIPAREEGLFASPFGSEQEKKTGKQYVTWFEQAQFSSFNQEASRGYTYVPEFDVRSITNAKAFEDRHVAREFEIEDEPEEVEAEEEVEGQGNGWGQAVQDGQETGAVQDEGKETTSSWGQTGASEGTGTGW
ncbi:uncharacterized protein K444DRAFT_689992 [Hyaloscypha bicolor E]|uniref:Uncharacterized protein n=1 Tax=Hyaloscypha bicolor E TaxID=1095630 RepID=A0A2J6TWN3_9HELO|nr:uncharacterized protein K444DRAFT_689992 [Hyaloscypha bicolor E]PMD67368.1 hypothetical protein K444DRAFT_689992 [Hyaloscypha bicolor E]